MQPTQVNHRYRKQQGPTLKNWKSPKGPMQSQLKKNVSLDCGWGRLIFGQTFESKGQLIKSLQREKKGSRDIAFYIQDPQVILSQLPGRLFLDPSHTYRIWFEKYRPSKSINRNVVIRRIQSQKDIEEINRMLMSRGMIPVDPEFLWKNRRSRTLLYLLAENKANQAPLGVVMGVDHVQAIRDPEGGSSLWSLCVDPACNVPGVGELLVRHLIEHYQVKGRSYLDLSVMHQNEQAIALYEKLHFERVQVFSVKCKNPFNQPLFMGPPPEEKLNIYARIIINEARRRGIHVEVEDEERGFFYLSSGMKRIFCRESLTDLTSAAAMSRVSDKVATHRFLKKRQFQLPFIWEGDDDESLRQFVREAQAVVVKPTSG